MIIGFPGFQAVPGLGLLLNPPPLWAIRNTVGPTELPANATKTQFSDFF